MQSIKLLTIATVAMAAMLGSALAQDLNAALGDLGHAWAKVYYLTPEPEQEARYSPVVAQAEALVRQYPKAAEPLIWQAIVFSSYAKAKGGLGAVTLAEKARDAALVAAKIDDRALDAGAYTALGVLYYKVPGWPIGFGSDRKAKDYLDKALAIAPTAVDINYFYGDFMIEQGDKQSARRFLERALQAPPRPGRDDADAGRKLEIESDLAKLGG